MALSRLRNVRIGIGLVAVTAVVGLTACAPEPVPESSPTVAPETPSPEPYTGPSLFVGDELAWFLPTAEEISALLPRATDIGTPSSALEQISDGGGPEPVPEICGTFFLEQSLWSVGSRNLEWTVAGESESGYGHLLALQFADEEQAQNRMDQLVTAAEQCATFDYNGAAAFVSVVPEVKDDVRALAGTLELPEIEGGNRGFSAFASVGNVLVQLWQTPGSGDVPDPSAIATLLQDRAVEAQQTLVEQLTATPPTTEEEPSVDAAAPWSDWEITTGGVGPIRLGDTVDAAVAAGGGAQVVEPEFEGDPWKLVNETGSASLLVQPADGGATVSGITVGNGRSLDEIAQDGAALPSLSGVRVGDPVSAALAAHPGGTTVSVVSSGDDWYDVATRDGRLFRFHTDRDVVDPAAVIVGITVEDATLRTGPTFG